VKAGRTRPAAEGNSPKILDEAVDDLIAAARCHALIAAVEVEVGACGGEDDAGWGGEGG